MHQLSGHLFSPAQHPNCRPPRHPTTTLGKKVECQAPLHTALGIRLSNEQLLAEGIVSDQQFQLKALMRWQAGRIITQKARHLAAWPGSNTTPFGQPANKCISQFLIMDYLDILFGKQLQVFLDLSLEIVHLGYTHLSLRKLEQLLHIGGHYTPPPI